MDVNLRNDRKEDACVPSLERDYPDQEIFACDFYVPEIERKGREVIGGYQWGRVVNVDHHAPTRAMERCVSSANLAIERIQALGFPSHPYSVVINHTDCDSVLSAGIMAGHLKPEARFGEAAVAADHTGEENAISDLLQALRQHRDYALSLRNLRLLLAGEPLEKPGMEALSERLRKRELARRRLGKFIMQGQMAYAEFEEEMDADFFLSLLPDAVAILISVPSIKAAHRHDIKLRLGHAAPEGFSLHALQITQYDDGYGGRWNAGSNRRNGGTGKSVDDYAKEAARRVDAVLNSRR
jgi:hypothetical protein